MTRTVSEGYLSFEFNEDWYVIKYDEQSYYRKTLSQSMESGFKATDIVGAYRNSICLLLEIKDYRGKSKKRLTGRKELIHNFKLKVKDTILGIIGGFLKDNRGADWNEIAMALIHKSKKPKIYLWIEQERQTNRANKKRIKSSRDTLQKCLQKEMNWLTDSKNVRLLWMDNYEKALPGVIAHNLPGAGK